MTTNQTPSPRRSEAGSGAVATASRPPRRTTSPTGPTGPTGRTGSTGSPPEGRSIARTAGIAYLLVIVFGLFAEVAVRSTLIEPGDAAATASNVADAEWLFRAGFGADVVVFLADVVLAVLLFRVFKPVDRTMSMLAAAFRLTQTAIISLNLLSMFAALRLFTGEADVGAFAPDQVDQLGLLLLDAHRYGYILGLTFFGMSTVLIARMALGSDGMPRPLGWFLLAAGVGYLTDSALWFLIPGYEGSVSPVVLAPAVVAEVWFALWLLLKGRTLHPRSAQAGAVVTEGGAR